MKRENPLTQTYTSALESYADNEARKKALENFKTRGLPHTKMEDWLYTKLSDVLPEKLLKVSTKPNIKDIETPGKYKLYFSNGQILEDKSSLPEGVILNVSTLKRETANDDQSDIFAMMNGVLNDVTVTLTIKKDFVLDSPLSIVHYSDFTGEFSAPRVHVVAENFSKAEIVEIFIGEDQKSYNVTAVSNFILKDGAKVLHAKVQDEGNEAFHVSSVNADVHRDANFHSFTFTTGAKKSRNEIKVRLRETGAYTSVDGLYALNDKQHTDNNSLITHIKEHTDSSQLFKGVLDDSSRGVFTGKVLVCRDAQKVNSEQLNKNLLLTKKSHADTRPQLEVYADDVKCAHGATVGQMNEEEAFYLQSRGLSKERAQKLLIHAFCSEALLKIENDEVREFCSKTLFKSFEEESFSHVDNRSAQKS